MSATRLSGLWYLEGASKMLVPRSVSCEPVQPADEPGGRCRRDHCLVAAWRVIDRTRGGHLHRVNPGFLLLVLLHIDYSCSGIQKKTRLSAAKFASQFKKFSQKPIVRTEDPIAASKSNINSPEKGFFFVLKTTWRYRKNLSNSEEFCISSSRSNLSCFTCQLERTLSSMRCRR
jgi:hypothetical protein